MKENEKYIVKITDQDSFGRGITRINNIVVFIDNALIGDTVEIIITKVKKRYSEGKILRIIKESKERITYECPYYDKCGGCNIGHQSYEYQLNFKKKKVTSAIERISKINTKILDVVPSNRFNYRNKAILRLNNNNIGFYKEETNEIISIDKCLICNDKINDIIKYISNYIKNNKHSIKEIFIRADKEVMISFDAINLDDTLINNLTNTISIDSIYLNNKLIYGKENINIKLLGLDFIVSKDSFFQVNKSQTERLYSKIVEYISDTKNNVILDLYCGVGTISCLLSKYSKKVIGIEVVKDAIDNANKNKDLNNINNIEFICNRVENVIKDINDKIDIVVLDPPRSGSDTTTLNTIKELNPKKIIYVSCNPETLARDIDILKDKYYVEEITPFDMFPNTYHVECIALMTKVE
jgi:23S rRNA (uracil1939-C5)-methyltransferase